MIKEHTYFTKGMHCASCEILIEKKLLEIPGIKSVEASTSDGHVIVEYEGEKPNINTLNNIFKKDSYTFFDPSSMLRASNNKENMQRQKVEEAKIPSFRPKEYPASANAKDSADKSAGKENTLDPTLLAFVIALFIVIAFLILDRMGISGLLNITSTSSLFAFFGFGLLAGLSSCAALVGGIVLSMSKQWQDIYANETNGYEKFQPHLMFNIGRILSYTLFGGVLGLIGSRLAISLGFTSFLVIAISFLMMGLGLQMLGVKAFRKFQFSMPRFITRRIANENNFKGKHMPFVMGVLTFFLPCGFTITAQTIALLTGNALQGALIMGFFALGTVPMLLMIGLSSVKFYSRPHWSKTFSKVAGFLVFFFALFNINNQISVLGFSLNNMFVFNSNQEQSQSQDTSDLAPMVNGKQLIKMTVFSVKYEPSYFKVKAGIPVKWEIISSGQPGCASGAVIANGLVNDPIYLNPNSGQVSVAEFTPQNSGNYRFSCTMNMVRGSIEVIN